MVFSSSSLPLRRTMSTAGMIMPGVQKPHCRPWFSRKASCIGCSFSPVARLSMVRTSAPSAVSARMVQDFTALPFTCTTQAPHCEVSQPTCVPVNRRFSRRNCTSRVRGSTSALTGLPFTIILTAGIGLLPDSMEWPVFRVRRQPRRNSRAKSGRFCLIFPIGTRASVHPLPLRVKPDRRSSRRLPARHRGSELRKKIIRHLLRRAGDQPLAELGELAADLCLDVVGKQRSAILVGERDHGTALGETRDAALAFAGDLV